MGRPLPRMTDAELKAAPGDEQSGLGVLRTPRGNLPLRALDVEGRIDGLLGQVRLRQTFVNPFDEPLEATYIFPLPDRSAVRGFLMEVAGRTIEGVLEEREKARRHYDLAIAEGRRAAIAEEDRPDVFTLRVGNLMPGEQATVHLDLAGVLPYAGGEVTFRFPLVVAPRYIPGTPLPGASVGDGTAVDNDATPDASRISPPVLLPGFPNPVQLSLTVDLHDLSGLVRPDHIRSSLHAIVCEENGDFLRVRLEPGDRLDRDFILRFRLGGDDPADPIVSTLTLHPDPAASKPGGTFALTMIPPAGLEQARRPRDIVFVLDRSGSMQGWKIVAARRAVGRMIDTLNEADRFGLIAFDDHIETPTRMPAGLVTAGDRQRFRALEYLAQVDARGGTEMAQPLKLATHLLSRSDRQAILVLITDGQVGNEDQILRTITPTLERIRVFTLGIDRAVNAGFLRRLADLGHGACELVESEDRLDEVMTAIHRQIGTPLLTNLAIEASGFAIEPDSLVPERLPDLFAGTPLVLLGRFHGPAAGTLNLRATDASHQTWPQSLDGSRRDNPAIAAAWARGQVRKLEDRYLVSPGHSSSLERQIVAVSLRHQVLSRFTAFVAIDHAEVANRSGHQHRVTQPVEQPSGWAEEARRSRSLNHPSVVQYSSPEAADALYSLAAPDEAFDFDAFEPTQPPAAPARARAGRFRRRMIDPKAVDREAGTPSMSPRASMPTASSAGSEPPSASMPSAPSAGGDFPPLERYERVERIGRGGMGEVFRAFDRERGREVSLRLEPPRPSQTPAFVQVLAALNHPSLERILDIIPVGGRILIVSESQPTGSRLGEVLSKSRPSEEQAARWMAEVAEAVQYLQDHGLVHRDIRPGRVLIDDRGTAVLADLATHAATIGTLPAGLGTAGYMAPERLEPGTGPDDPRSSVFSIGVLLYQLLTGVLPFRGAGVTDLFTSVRTGTVAPPRSIRRSIPAGLETICLKALSHKPTDRYADAGELARALREFLEHSPRPRKSFWKRG